MNEISIIDSLISSLIGIALVFIVLFILIIAIKIMSAVVDLFEAKRQSKSDKAQEEASRAKPDVRLAKGSCGGVKLYDIPDRTAAMLMAITADKLNLPLNQIRFISIREIKDEEKEAK